MGWRQRANPGPGVGCRANARIEVDDVRAREDADRNAAPAGNSVGNSALGWPMGAWTIRMLGLGAAAPCRTRARESGPTLFWRGFSTGNSTKFLGFPFSSFLLQIVMGVPPWRCCFNRRCICGIRHFGAMGAQRRKRSVVNHCRQFLQSGGCFILEIYISACARRCHASVIGCC